MCVLVICVLVFTVFCIVYTVFLCCFFYVHLFLFVLPVLKQGLLPPSDNSIAVNNNNNNNNNIQLLPSLETCDARNSPSSLLAPQDTV